MKIFKIYELEDFGKSTTLMYLAEENEEIAEKKAREIYPGYGGHLRLLEISRETIQKKVTELTKELDMYKELLTKK